MTDIDDVETPDDDEPDFAALYEPYVDSGGWQTTPRMAWYLWSAALYLADDGARVAPTRLPPSFRRPPGRSPMTVTGANSSSRAVRVTNAAMDFIWAADLAPIGSEVWVHGTIPR